MKGKIKHYVFLAIAITVQILYIMNSKSSTPQTPSPINSQPKLADPKQPKSTPLDTEVDDILKRANSAFHNEKPSPNPQKTPSSSSSNLNQNSDLYQTDKSERKSPLDYYLVLKTYDLKDYHFFNRYWFAPPKCIIELGTGSSVFSIDEKRFMIHRLPKQPYSMWVERSLFDEKIKMVRSSQKVISKLKVAKMANAEPRELVLQKYVDNPLLTSQGFQFDIVLTATIYQDSPFLMYANEYSIIVSSEKYADFEYSISEDFENLNQNQKFRCAYFLECQGKEQVFNNLKTFAKKQLNIFGETFDRVHKRIIAIATYVVTAYKESRAFGDLDPHKSRDVQFKFIINEDFEVYLFNFEMGIPFKRELRVPATDKNRIIIDQTEKFHFLRDYEDNTWERSSLDRFYRTPIAFIQKGPNRRVFVKYFVKRKDHLMFVNLDAKYNFLKREADLVFSRKFPPRMDRIGKAYYTYFQRSHLIEDKDHMNRNLALYDKKSLYFFNSTWFIPRTYNLDLKNEKFTEDEQAFLALPEKGVWLKKTATGFGGSGVALNYDLKEAKKKFLEEKGKSNDGAVFQQYIVKPLLIERQKFDLRNIGMVVSTKPFILLFRQGWIRRSLEEYDLFDPRMFIHVVNVSFQKKHKRFKELQDDVHWSMQEFQEYLTDRKIADPKTIQKLYDRMAAIITYTYETILSELTSDRSGTYQLFGYDFMFDEDLSTYLIEVNREPYVIESTRVHKQAVPVIVKQFMDMSLYCQEMKDLRKFPDEQVLKSMCPSCQVLINEARNYSFLQDFKDEEFRPHDNARAQASLNIPKDLLVGEVQFSADPSVLSSQKKANQEEFEDEEENGDNLDESDVLNN